MRHRKIRGHRRRWKDVDHWLAYSKPLNLDYLEDYGREYVKIQIHPWNGLSLQNSAYRQPKGKTKQLMLSGLLQVYEEWEKVLETLNQPYYLKIWLFEPRFNQSQVVCALGDRMDYYNTLFGDASKNDKQAFLNYGQLNEKLKEFIWKPQLDEDEMDISHVGSQEDYNSIEEFNAELKEFEKRLLKPHRVYKLDMPLEDVTELYFFKRGLVWTGEKKLRNITHEK